MMIMLHFIMVLVLSLGLCVPTAYAKIDIEDSIVTLSPKRGDLLPDARVKFVWKNNNRGRYAIEVANDSFFLSNQIMGNIHDTSLTLTDDLAGALGIAPGRKYYWRVMSGSDDSGYYKPIKSPTAWFMILPDTSSKPLIYQPDTRGIIDSTNIFIRWSRVNTAIGYNVLLTKTITLDTLVDTLVTDTMYSIPHLTKGSYLISIGALDSSMHITKSPVNYFSIGRILNKEPTLLSPSDSAQNVPLQCFFIWKPNVHGKIIYRHSIRIFKMTGEFMSSIPPIIDTVINNDSTFTYNLEPNTKYFWQVTEVTDGDPANIIDRQSPFFVLTTMSSADVASMASFAGLSVFPNPIRVQGVLTCFLKTSGSITLEIIDATGKIIKNLFTEYMNEGYHQIPINMQSIPTGQFMLVLKQGSSILAIPIIKL